MLSDVALGNINVSMDAARPETYRNIRGSDMRKSVEGIRRLSAMVKHRGLHANVLSMSMVLMRQNIEEVSDFIRLAHSLGIGRVYLEHMTMPFGGRKNWVVQRGDFKFVYDEASLLGEREYSDRLMLEALEVAQELDVTFGGPDPFILPGNQQRAKRYTVRARALGLPSDFAD